MKLEYHHLEEETFNFLYRKHLANPAFTFSTRKKFSTSAIDDYFIGTANSAYFAFTLWDIPLWYPGASIDLLDFIVVTNKPEPYFYFQYYMYKNISETQNKLNLNFSNELINTFNGYPEIEIIDSQKQKKIYLFPGIIDSNDFFNSFNIFINNIAPKIDLAINNFLLRHNNWQANKISSVTFDKNLSRLSNKLDLKFTSNFEQLLSDQENKKVKKILENPSLSSTEKESLTKSRIGQSIFRDNLISLWGCCAISGYDRTELLRASHIKPWRVCDNSERVDMYNGFLLMPNYDLLFDKYWISFKEDGDILISKKLTRRDRSILNLNNDIRINIKDENKKYLFYHRDQFYLNENIA